MKIRAAQSTLLAAILVLAACQASPAPTPAATAAPTPAATAPTVPATPAQLTLTDDEGTTVTLAGVPEKVVSLTPATTELLFALGVGEKLAGRTDFDDYPPDALAAPVVATFEGVNVEQVVDIEPDLVIAGGNNFTPSDDIARLRDLGINVLVIYAQDVDGVLNDILLIGHAVGADDEALGLFEDISARIDEVGNAVAELERPRVFYEIGNVPEIYGPAPNSFVADLVSIAGGEPITTTDPAVFSIPLERLVTEDPQVIVLGDAAYGVCPTDLVTRAGWSGISAVSDGNVRPVDDIIVTRPGPRLGEGLAALALAIHPEADIDPPTQGAEYCQTL